MARQLSMTKPRNETWVKFHVIEVQILVSVTSTVREQKYPKRWDTRVMVDLEPVPVTLGERQKYTLDGL